MLVRGADNLTAIFEPIVETIGSKMAVRLCAIFEPIVETMWEP
jgi:hypothetical protein